MAKKKAATTDSVREDARTRQVLAALSGVKSILDSLSPDLKEFVEVSLFGTPGYFDGIRRTFHISIQESFRKTTKLRRRKPDPKIRERDVRLAKEKLKISWSRMDKNHPELSRSGLRNAVKQGMQHLKNSMPQSEDSK